MASRSKAESRFFTPAIMCEHPLSFFFEVVFDGLRSYILRAIIWTTGKYPIKQTPKVFRSFQVRSRDLRVSTFVTGKLGFSPMTRSQSQTSKNTTNSVVSSACLKLRQNVFRKKHAEHRVQLPKGPFKINPFTK